MLSFLKFRGKQKSSKGNKAQCASTQIGASFHNSPPPQRHHSNHSNRHLTSYQEKSEQVLILGDQLDNAVKGNLERPGSRSTKPSSGLLSAKLQCDEWGFQSRVPGIHKKTSNPPTHAKVNPQRKPQPRKFLSMAQYVQLADEMRGSKNSRHGHPHYHPSHKSPIEHHRSRSMKERREFREIQNVSGTNFHKKFAHTHPIGKVTMSTLYRIDEEDHVGGGGEDRMSALEYEI